MTDLEKAFAELQDYDQFADEFTALSTLKDSECELRKIQAEVLRSEISRDRGTRH